MVNNLSELISGTVRPIITIMLTATLCYGFIATKIPQEQFLPIVVMVVGFWFGDRSASKRMSTIRGQVSG